MPSIPLNWQPLQNMFWPPIMCIILPWFLFPLTQFLLGAEPCYKRAFDNIIFFFFYLRLSGFHSWPKPSPHEQLAYRCSIFLSFLYFILFFIVLQDKDCILEAPSEEGPRLHMLKNTKKKWSFTIRWMQPMIFWLAPFIFPSTIFFNPYRVLTY